MRRIVNLLFVFVLFSSCNKEVPDIVIQPELEPYFDLFKTEAEKRGIAFDVNVAKITTEMVNITGDNIIAQCTRFQDQPSVIKVDLAYWNTASLTDREFYLFHELGHCFLNRSHNNEKDTNGNCISIMHSSKDACKFLYSKLNRDKYLDELFKK
jgi:hypothetical protein